MRYLCTIILLSAIAFTSCSDDSLQENEEIIQMDNPIKPTVTKATTIYRFERKQAPVFGADEQPTAEPKPTDTTWQPLYSTQEIDREDYEVPPNG